MSHEECPIRRVIGQVAVFDSTAADAKLSSDTDENESQYRAKM